MADDNGITGASGGASIDPSAGALLDIDQMVEQLQNNSVDGKFDDAAQAEFLQLGNRLRKDCNVLEKQRMAQDTQESNDAVKSIQGAAAYVKAQKDKLADIAANSTRWLKCCK